MISIKKGLDIPISGSPKQQIEIGPAITEVAVVGTDYVGIKPTMLVREGDSVIIGQPLLEDKKNPGVFITSPAAGTVKAVNRGERRALQSIVVEVAEHEESQKFTAHDASYLGSLERQIVVDQLVDSGQWTAFRTRPFSKVPAVDSTPRSIFVNAMDTNPLAADPQVVIAESSQDFHNGLIVLERLTEGSVFVTTAPDFSPEIPNGGRIVNKQFSGPHPAGLAGTHIHCLDPVSPERSVWTISYQDVIAIGALFTTGQLSVTRVVALGGPQVNSPRLLKTRLGARLTQLTANELNEEENRIISGSILNGFAAKGPFAYLGRYNDQVSVLREGRERPMLHYLVAGKNRFSAMPIYLSRLLGKKSWDFTTSTNGSERAMVPVGAYEKVMPLDVLPTQLLRSLIVGDTEMAQKLGALELDEEDLALCTYVCPGKYEYGPILRDNLARIEKEG